MSYCMQQVMTVAYMAFLHVANRYIDQANRRLDSSVCFCLTVQTVLLKVGGPYAVFETFSMGLSGPSPTKSDVGSRSGEG
jgi:hypothetical protein